MNRKLLLKIIFFTIILALADILLYSKGIIGIQISKISIENLLLTVLTVIANTVILYMEIKYIMTSTEMKYGYDMEKLKNTGDYREALQSCMGRKIPFKNEIKTAIYQLESIERKRKVLDELLEQNNKENFTALIELGDETKDFICVNARKILNIISIFDETEYNNNQGNLKEEHITYINKILDSNTKIINEFNNFLTEVSKIGDTDAKVNVSQILGEMTNSLKTLRGEK